MTGCQAALGRGLFTLCSTVAGNCNTRMTSLFFRSHANRNTARFGKRIGHHFKFLAVDANALAGTVTETLHTGTDFRNRRGFGRMAGHDATYLTRLQTHKEGEPFSGFCNQVIALVEGVLSEIGMLRQSPARGIGGRDKGRVCA